MSKAWKYYKLLFAEDQDGNALGLDLAEIQFNIAGVNQAIGATVSASSTFSTLVASNAVDGNTSTRWASDFSGTWPQWFKIDFGGSPKNIDEIKIMVASATNRGPAAFMVTVSDDDITYYFCNEFEFQPAYTIGAFRAFTITTPNAHSPVGYKYGRLRVTALISDTLLELTEIGVYKSNERHSLAQTTTMSGGSPTNVYSGTDGLIRQTMFCNFSNPTDIIFTFDEAFRPDELWIWPHYTNSIRTPKDFTFALSNDLSTWTTVLTQSGLTTGWTADTVRKFTLTLPSIVVTSLSPNTGLVGGGTAVTITGSGFTGSTGVLFGASSATSVIVVNDTTITCDTPAHAAGAVTVTVQNPTGDGTLASGYTYTTGAATVTSVLPNTGPIAGGTSVTITGTNFSSATGATFDGNAATSFVVVNSTTITCHTPAGSVGAVDVVVQSPDGDGTLTHGFTYVSVEARVTQAPLLILDASEQPARVTQAPVLVLYQPLEGDRVTQAPLLVLYEPKPVPLPAPVVPETPLLESWTWLTTVKPGLDSKEQRFRLRDTPRYKQQINAIIQNEDDRRVIYNMLMRYLKTPFPYPLYQYNTYLTASATAGDTKLFCDTSRTDLRDGEQIALFDPELETTKFLQATTIDADGVNLASAVPADIPASWQICPVIPFRITPSVGITMRNIEGKLGLVMESVSPRVFQRPGAEPTLTTIDDVLIVPERPLANDDVPENFDNGGTWFDNSYGAVDILNEWTNPHAMGERTYSFDRHSDRMDYWRGICDELKGRQGVCLLPTFRDDLPLRDPMVLNSVSFTSNNTNFFNWFLDTNYRYVQIETANGIKYRRVNSVVPHYDANGDPDWITVTLASSTGNTAGDNVISSISYMNLCRLDADEIKLTHYALDTEIVIPFKAVDV
jgi:hypothetical protein